MPPVPQCSTARATSPLSVIHFDSVARNGISGFITVSPQYGVSAPEMGKK